MCGRYCYVPPRSSGTRKFSSQWLWVLSEDDPQLPSILEDCLRWGKLPGTVGLLLGKVRIQWLIYISIEKPGPCVTSRQLWRAIPCSRAWPHVINWALHEDSVTAASAQSCSFLLPTVIPSEHWLISILFMNLNLRVCFWETQPTTSSEPRSYDDMMTDTVSRPGGWTD